MRISVSKACSRVDVRERVRPPLRNGSQNWCDVVGILIPLCGANQRLCRIGGRLSNRSSARSLHSKLPFSRFYLTASLADASSVSDRKACEYVLSSFSFYWRALPRLLMRRTCKTAPSATPPGFYMATTCRRASTTRVGFSGMDQEICTMCLPGVGGSVRLRRRSRCLRRGRRPAVRLDLLASAGRQISRRERIPRLRG